MNMEEKVFKSDVIRVQTTKTDDLYSLLRRSPAIPIQKVTNNLQPTCDFQPKKDKYYVPKKKSKLKVKTVRNIRHSFEKDINEILPVELDKQQSYLLRKIKSGSSKDDSTKTLAKNILKLNKPISRTAWQMLMNINPFNKNHPFQYVLWGGSQIKINGSKGGSTKLLHKFDLLKNACYVPKSNIVNAVNLSESKKKNLLKTSVNIKFKPGPLSKKNNLDCSYQKHQVGQTELVKLPTPVLEIYPSHGHALDSSIANYLHNMRDLDGLVSQQWAEMAASAVGTVRDGKLLKEPPNVVQFQLTYKNEQRQILMRNNGINKINNSCNNFTNPAKNETFDEIKTILDEMISSVEISLEQNNLLIDDVPRLVSPLDINMSSGDSAKDKSKKRYCELDRLDVTVIQLSDERVEDLHKKCKKSFCTLGCICSSLECRKIVKGHCGLIKCMFECKCDFSKYASYENFPEVLSRLVSLDHEISNKLAKEEQKFHQTVVMTGEKGIVLKSESRSLKTPKKYANFYKNMCLKNKIPSTRLVSVMSLKLNCENIEPWCMVHNLYKCFCEGKFLESNSITENKPDSHISVNDLNTVERHCIETITKRDSNSNKSKTYPICDNYNMDPMTDDAGSDMYLQCSRVLPFLKRKYDLAYYRKLSHKIVHMESNDYKLQKKLLQLGFKCRNEPENSEGGDSCSESMTPFDSAVNVKKTIKQIKENHENSKKTYSDVALESTIVLDDSESESSEQKTEIKQPKKLKERENGIPQNGTLVKWLEISYKKYKDEIEKGIEKTSLDPPKVGTMSLYSWSFIYNRYRGRKNLFLVSKSPPYRIFVAVTMKHPMFENCINIDEIRFADLHKYPTTVKNLLTNANDLTSHFFIFRGLSHCWELVGSACRIDEKPKETKIQNTGNESDKLSLDVDDNASCSETCKKSDDVSKATDSQEVHKTEMTKNNSVLDSSKWFVMTIENDFSEIQFYKKGFFVKYESIIKAIQVSRSSGNTVRLSSVQQVDQVCTPHFGIYAIPNADQYCVFIGPYEKDEPLGIETVKSYADNIKKKRTRGVWITTNKVDNFKVIDNPLYFMPCLSKSANNEIQLDNVDQELVSQPLPPSSVASENSSISQKGSANTSNDNSPPKDNSSPKKIKRILIRKTKPGFFKVMPKEDIHENRQGACNDQDLEWNQTKNNPVASNYSNVSIKKTMYQATKRPVAEIAPQVKDSTNKIGRISVLNLDQINQKILEMSDLEDSHIENDIENFLATSVICASPNLTNKDSCTAIWIECKTIQGLGCIKGKMRTDSLISFQFPGFKLSPFYKKDEAIQKINQVLSRKVYLPKHIKLEWEVVNSVDKLSCKTMLKSEDLCSDMVLTERGLIHKRFIQSRPESSAEPGSSALNVEGAIEEDGSSS